MHVNLIIRPAEKLRRIGENFSNSKYSITSFQLSIVTFILLLIALSIKIIIYISNEKKDPTKTTKGISTLTESINVWKNRTSSLNIITKGLIPLSLWPLFHALACPQSPRFWLLITSFPAIVVKLKLLLKFHYISSRERLSFPVVSKVRKSSHFLKDSQCPTSRGEGLDEPTHIIWMRMEQDLGPSKIWVSFPQKRGSW